MARGFLLVICCLQITISLRGTEGASNFNILLQTINSCYLKSQIKTQPVAIAKSCEDDVTRVLQSDSAKKSFTELYGNSKIYGRFLTSTSDTTPSLAADQRSWVRSSACNEADSSAISRCIPSTWTQLPTATAYWCPAPHEVLASTLCLKGLREGVSYNSYLIRDVGAGLSAELSYTSEECRCQQQPKSPNCRKDMFPILNDRCLEIAANAKDATCRMAYRSILCLLGSSKTRLERFGMVEEVQNKTEDLYSRLDNKCKKNYPKPEIMKGCPDFLSEEKGQQSLQMMYCYITWRTICTSCSNATLQYADQKIKDTENFIRANLDGTKGLKSFGAMIDRLDECFPKTGTAQNRGGCVLGAIDNLQSPVTKKLLSGVRDRYWAYKLQVPQFGHVRDCLLSYWLDPTNSGYFCPEPDAITRPVQCLKRLVDQTESATDRRLIIVVIAELQFAAHKCRCLRLGPSYPCHKDVYLSNDEMCSSIPDNYQFTPCTDVSKLYSCLSSIQAVHGNLYEVTTGYGSKMVSLLPFMFQCNPDGATGICRAISASDHCEEAEQKKNCYTSLESFCQTGAKCSPLIGRISTEMDLVSKVIAGCPKRKAQPVPLI